ncbi:signal transduction histidine kinase [Chitinophaga niastensis]|uniref:histidine kinase n=1 Tax=Chitinophaga niastensis TaxID=536980 RepID=A0A2P8HC33_CHINA|nr:ATP-binding protein [Chitinophaga niastensis]PSL43796.1 signal transduction histidine kinase [Chitinophaga niastensis]
MLLPPVHVNVVIFVIVMIEFAIFFTQLLSFLARPYEKNRLWHVVLTGLLIIYNLGENLLVLPDKNIPLSVIAQNIIYETPGYFVTMYIPFYCYKTLDLDRLRFHGRYGFLFLLIPTIFFFFIWYPLNGNLEQTMQYAYIIPGCYAFVALYATRRAIILKYREEKNKTAYRERMWIYMAVVVWAISPLIEMFSQQPKWISGALFNNFNFLVLYVLLTRQTVKRFLAEYNQLQESNKTLTEKVKERTMQLEKANEQRTNTFVNLVHETKTPLTLINNYLEEYINKYGHRKELMIVKNSVDKLNKDISNLFDLERYNKGFIIYNHDQVANFSQILSDNLILFKIYCRKKNVELQGAIEEDVLIKADPGAINGIVINLIENAVKYTSANGEINIALETDDSKIRFTVKDNGIGIKEELHDKIFEPYYQINSQKGGFQGMGLGLPIVKKTVNDLKGWITIGSNPEKKQGTKITISLNRHITVENEATASDYLVNNYAALDMEMAIVPDSDYNDKKQTVLIIEDNIAMVNYLSKKLSEKYNVAAALNGNEALAKIKSYAALPDLIVSDVMMDKMDGFKFAKIMSEAPDCRHIPFIFLSAKAASRDRFQGLKLGAVDFIQKPFNTEELILKIGAVLENAAKQKRMLFDNALRNMKRGNIPEVIQAAPVAQVTPNRFEQNCSTYQLTIREIAISKLIREGFSYKQIAETLFIAEKTVQKHVQNIFEKVEISNKVQLINKLEA